MSSLNSEIVINLSGNLMNKARQYSGAMNDFAQSNSRMAQGFRIAATGVNRGLDAMENRYTALVATVAGGAVANRLVALDRRLSRLSVAADMTKEEVTALYEDIESESVKVGFDPSETLAGFEVIMEKIGDIKMAKDNIGNIAIIAQATGANGGDVGAVLTQLKTLSIETQAEVMAAMDTLNVQGKSGSFTLNAFASNGERLLAAYAATGRKGVTAVRELGAAMQVIRKGVGSDDQAVTAYERLMTELTDPTRTAKLKKAGIEVFDPEQLKNGIEILRPLPELMQEISEAANGNSRRWKFFNFGDEAKRAFTSLNAELKKSGEIKGFDDFVNIVGDGSVTMADANKVAQDYASGIEKISTAVNNLMRRELAEPFQDIADAVNGLDAEALDRWLQLGKNIAYVAGTLLVARKALGVARDIKDVFGKNNNGGKSGKNSNTGVNDLFGGVTPVYVVNMPGSLPGTGSGDVVPIGDGRNNNPRTHSPRSSGRWPGLGKILSGGAFAYSMVEGAEFAADLLYNGSGAGDWVRKNVSPHTQIEVPDTMPAAPSFQDAWKELTDFLSHRGTNIQAEGHPGYLTGSSSQTGRASYPAQLQGKIDIEVHDERVKVRRATTNQPIQLGYQNGLSMAD
ncbi:phage tail tape measure protein [Photobacterium arenosum]|uniref:phage tail tape measure protein n=1 Tax=Photobacterium arenosum TaxID=2774143 RepID=UPI00288B5EE9|nr:hypothetical protein [Photobacterium arenosum]